MEAMLLVVEDDDAIGAIMVEVLAGEGYKVVYAASAQQARAVLATPQAAALGLVLSDSFGPRSTDSDGWLSELRSLTKAPIIISSAWARVTYADYADHGFAAVFPKPFDIDDLIATVAAHYDYDRSGMAGTIRAGGAASMWAKRSATPWANAGQGAALIYG